MLKLSELMPHSSSVGWILCLRAFADIFNIEGFKIWHLVMTVIMCTTWVVLFALTAVAFWKRKIFISPPEAILRDQLGVKTVSDVEKGPATDDEEHALGEERTMTEVQYAQRISAEPEQLSERDGDGLNAYRL